MGDEKLDEILLEGELISTCVNASSNLITFFNRSSTTDKERESFVKSLDSIWKALVSYQTKYPDSDYIKNAKDQTLKYAKTSLPDNLYNKIYNTN